MNKLLLACMFLFMGCPVFLNARHCRMLVIDTGFNNPYIYKNFLMLAKSVGFKPEVKNFSVLLPKDLDGYDCIIINLDEGIAYDYACHKADIQRAGPLTQRVLSLLAVAGEKKLLGLMLPSRMGTSIKDTCQNIFDLKLPHLETTNAVKRSLCIFLRELFQSDSKRSIKYHTTLLTKREKKDQDSDCTAKVKIPNCVDTTNNSLIVGHLPFHTFRSLPPLAWYFTNSACNHLFITKASLILFSDICENFIYNPLDFSVRTERLQELQQLLYELYQVCAKGVFLKSTQSHSLKLPQEFSKNFLLKQKKKLSAVRSARVDKKLYGWVEREAVWCGWGSLEPYKDEKAVRSLAASGINLLWFEMNPEWYLASTALKKNELKQFLQTIDTVTKNFKNQSKKSHLPHIFVGTDITSNYARAPVKNPSVDCFGTVYSKIPSPLDFDNFWKPELLDVFDNLVEQWSLHNHGIPLSGIFLDLEMYHAQDETGHYLTTMDFSDYAWQIYCSQVNAQDCLNHTTVNERISYLLKNNFFERFFEVLEKKAYEIGCAIKNHVNKKLPNALIAIYDIHLPHTWFYKGLLAGLSSPERPLILATFNTDFYCHWSWLIKNKIYAYHLPVLLLSKFKSEQDFDLISDVTQFHDGAWFNRISRLEESRDSKDWQWDYAVEVTPLPTHDFVKYLQNAIMRAQSLLPSTCIK